MKITHKTKYRNVAFLLRRMDVLQKALEVITEEDVARICKTPFIEMTIGDYISYCDALEGGDLEEVMCKLFPSLFTGRLRAWWHYHTLSALEVLAKLKWLLDGCKEVAEILKGCDVQLDELEMQASKAVTWQHPHIIMVAFCVERFHLRSYDEGEQTKIADYLMEKQKESNNARYQRRLSKLHQEQIKNK